MQSKTVFNPAIRCEACDNMLNEGDMGDALCGVCKHAVAMCLDMDDDELAFTTVNEDAVEIISLEELKE